MSPRRATQRYSHMVDVYQKTTVANDTGQLIASWTPLVVGQICFATPSGSGASIRIVPTAEEADLYTFLFPHDAPINYGTRLQSVRTRVGSEAIYSGVFQIVQIDTHISFSGRPQFLQVRAKTVIE